jgi:hypothetical protein
MLIGPSFEVHITSALNHSHHGGDGNQSRSIYGTTQVLVRCHSEAVHSGDGARSAGSSSNTLFPRFICRPSNESPFLCGCMSYGVLFLFTISSYFLFFTITTERKCRIQTIGASQSVAAEVPCHPSTFQNRDSIVAKEVLSLFLFSHFLVFYRCLID